MATIPSSFSWIIKAFLLLVGLRQALAYRPVQHCKVVGENGHYSACTGVTQYYNATTGQSDLYVRYQWYRYRSSNKGWHSIALGYQMTGALMLIMYGDPNTPQLPMTVDVRTADGHHPPQLISESVEFKNQMPVVDVVTARFDKYDGDLRYPELDEKPTHVGVCEAIIRGYEHWPGVSSNNASTGMRMIWGSNYEQNMDHDFSPGRDIEMHKFGLGFGWLYVDVLNAEVPEPMFGAIDELVHTKGANEDEAPPAPTADELQAGDAYIAQVRSGADAAAVKPEAPTVESAPGGSDKTDKEQNDDPVPSEPDATPAPEIPIEQPARTFFGKSARDWMWHLHGLLMTLAFLALYPLGTYLIRSQSATAFNSHWTIQSLATVSLFIGAVIGWVESYSISIKHQYIGIFIMLAVAAQILLGWRHHVRFLATKQRTWLSKSHIVLGRIILPLGFVNIVLGMMRRGYGWFTLTLVVILIGLESAFLAYVLYRASKQGTAANESRGATTGPPRGEDAEEYFQLAGDDEFSDSDEEHYGVEGTRETQRREQAERLRRLDKV